MKIHSFKVGGLLFIAACCSLQAATVDVLNYGATGWKYLIGTQEASSPTDAWRVPAFNDASWSTGTAPIGYPTTPPDSALEGTLSSGTILPNGTVGGYTCVFLRHPVVINNPASLAQLTLTIRFDDGYVVWFNGVELGRSANVPPGPPNVGTLATPEREVTASEDTFNISGSLLLAGANTLAIQVFNGAATSSDLFIDARLVGTVDDVAPTIAALNPPNGATVPQLNAINVTFS
ncbi:MAG TPA: hypothetical protein VJS65_10370, partial [Verrucomicrobiae bacterium]|nr:hypothetical protein [Verrucomicrobiae bacterium]